MPHFTKFFQVRRVPRVMQVPWILKAVKASCVLKAPPAHMTETITKQTELRKQHTLNIV